MKIAIVGFGLQGRSNYNYYQKLYPQAQITICDQNETLKDVPASANLSLGLNYLNNLDAYDLIVRTPFLRPDKIIKANTKDILDKLTTASNEFFRVVKTPIIAVTGTKGKGTTCLILEAILKQAGLKVVLMGNIGIPPLDVVKEAQVADVVVFEIASYQTMDLKYSPQVGVCLNMAAEHLDWHLDYKEYLRAKSQLFIHQTPSDLVVYPLNDLDAQKIVKPSQAQARSFNCLDSKADVHIKDQKIYFKNEALAQTKDIKLQGDHNLKNICAAIAACYDFLPSAEAPSIIKTALEACHNFAHRLQTIALINRVTYINDSYATTPEASIAALKSIKTPVVLIAGGHSKNVSLKEFSNQILKSEIRALILIGKTGQEIKEDIKSSNPDFPIIDSCQNMDEIIQACQEFAQTGDTVLLSTASASFGMFNNATHRGQLFTQTVLKLSE